MPPDRRKAVAEGAAPSYRFRIDHGTICWEIPLGEIVTGRVDGRPMTIRRRGKSDGMTLSVTAEGPYVLRYGVTRAGKPFGSGVMSFAEGGRAWVDTTRETDRALDSLRLL